MKTLALNNFIKSMLLTIVFTIGSLFLYAGEKSGAERNTLSYDLRKATVKIVFDNNSQSETKRSIDELQPAKFVLSKNMTINGLHIHKGEYKVSLIEGTEGLALQFEDEANNRDNQIVGLQSQPGMQSDFINYSLGLLEDDKLYGEINFDGYDYSFTMEVALSNTIFSYIEKEDKENTSDWLDYYQAAIYAYKNKIDLNDSYEYAQKALQTGQNEYTIELSLMYLEALGRDNEAKQLSALQE